MRYVVMHNRFSAYNGSRCSSQAGGTFGTLPLALEYAEWLRRGAITPRRSWGDLVYVTGFEVAGIEPRAILE